MKKVPSLVLSLISVLAFSSTIRPYSRGSVATANAPSMNIDVPIPKSLADVFGPAGSSLSEKERGTRELTSYLEDPAYAKYMAERIHRAAQSISDLKERARIEKLSLGDLVLEWKRDFPGLNHQEIALNLAALEFGAASALTKIDPSLCEMARKTAQNAAKAEKLSGRANWLLRSGAVVSKYSGENVSATVEESEAESSNFLGNALMEHAQECVRSWWYNAKYRASLNQHQSLACHTMTKGITGRYFCVGQYVKLLKTTNSKPS